jgi:hypothetical protein
MPSAATKIAKRIILLHQFRRPIMMDDHGKQKSCLKFPTATGKSQKIIQQNNDILQLDRHVVPMGHISGVAVFMASELF